MIKVLLPGVAFEQQMQLYQQGREISTMPQDEGTASPVARGKALTPLRAAGLGALCAVGGMMALANACLWLALWGLSAGSSLLFLGLALGSLALGGLGLIGAPALWGYALVRGLSDLFGRIR